MEKKSYTTNSEIQTQKLGAEFASHVLRGDSILLTGELGAGKTTFVRGVASGLAVKSRVTSPNFVIVRKHKVSAKTKTKIESLYHVDLYRVDSAEKLQDLGLDEAFEDPDGIVLIEWGKKAPKTKFDWEIDFKILDDKSRKISFKKFKKNE